MQLKGGHEWCVRFCCTQARPRLRDPGRLLELLDARLAAAGDYQMEELQEVAAIAEACVAPEAQDRPTMGEVVESLRMLQVRKQPKTKAKASKAAQPWVKRKSTLHPCFCGNPAFLTLLTSTMHHAGKHSQRTVPCCTWHK